MKGLREICERAIGQPNSLRAIQALWFRDSKRGVPVAVSEQTERDEMLSQALPYLHNLREIVYQTSHPNLEGGLLRLLQKSPRLRFFWCDFYPTIDKRHPSASNVCALDSLAATVSSKLPDLKHLFLSRLASNLEPNPGHLGLLQPPFHLTQLALHECAINDREFRGLIGSQTGR